MSDRKIRSFIFIDEISKVVVFTKRAIGLDLRLEVPGIRVEELVTEKPISFPQGFDHTYTADEGFTALPAQPDEKTLRRVELTRKKLEILTLLNTNVQLLIGVLEDRFTAAHADTIQVSAENRPLLNQFLKDERDLLVARCRRQLTGLVDSVLRLQSADEVQAFYKDFSDHTIIGDYSASNRGML